MRHFGKTRLCELGWQNSGGLTRSGASNTTGGARKPSAFLSLSCRSFDFCNSARNRAQRSPTNSESCRRRHDDDRRAQRRSSCCGGASCCGDERASSHLSLSQKGAICVGFRPASEREGARLGWNKNERPMAQMSYINSLPT